MASKPLRLTQNGQSDANGGLSLTFPAVPSTRIYQATVTVPGSPNGSTWELAIGDTQFQSLLGPGPYGPFQIFPGEKVVLTGQGLSTSASYTGVLAGVDDDLDHPTPYTGPTALPSPVNPQALLIGSFHVPNSPTGFQTNICPVGATGLLLVANAPMTLEVLQGLNSSIDYEVDLNMLADTPYYNFTYNSTVDPQLGLAAVAEGVGTILQIYALFDPVISTTGIPGQPIPPSVQVVAGSDNGTTEVIKTDSSGRIIPLGPNEVYFSNAVVDGQILPILTNGTLYYLFGMDLSFFATSNNFVAVLANGVAVGSVACNAVNAGADHCDLNGYETPGPIQLSVANANGDFTLRYAIA